MQIRLNSQSEIDKPPAPRRGPRKGILARLMVYLPLIWCSWCMAMYFFQDRLIFPCDLAPRPAACAGVLPNNVLTVTTEGGQAVEGWFLPARDTDADHPAPAVLYFHGNAEIIDFQDRVESLWYRLGVSLLMPEYRGYGRAAHAGSPSEQALVDDGVKFYDQLIRRPDVDPYRIIIHGYSIGGGVAAQVAAQRRPAALILECTFTSVADFAWGYGVPPFLARHPFHTDEILPRLGIPIFISHGRADTIVPVTHGQRLHAITPNSTYVELSCGHLDMPGAGSTDYGERLRSFLAQAGVLQPMTNNTPNITTQTTSRKCQ